MSHLRRRSYRHLGMGSYPNCELPRRHMFRTITPNVEPDLILNRREPYKPFPELIRHPDAGQILVAFPISKPSAHLQERVVSRGTSDEIAGDKALERKSARE